MSRGKKMSMAEMTVAVQNSPTAQQKARELEETIAVLAKHRRNYEIPVKGSGHTLRFALIGDTQIGSLYQRLDALEKFYQVCKAECIRNVFHAGDLLDGWKVYKGQEFELCARGWNEQAQMFRKQYPYISGCTTHFITGNHDLSFKKLVGLPVGPELVNLRGDFDYMGEDVASMTLRTESGRPYKLMLAHPSGGTAYAISYRIQKTVEALAGGTKPNMIALGHFHKAEMLPSYRDVAAIQVGCFQSQTPFMKTKPISAHVGGWLIEVTVGDRKGLSNRVRAEFISFYEPEEM